MRKLLEALVLGGLLMACLTPSSFSSPLPEDAEPQPLLTGEQQHFPDDGHEHNSNLGPKHSPLDGHDHHGPDFNYLDYQVDPVLDDETSGGLAFDAESLDKELASSQS